MVIVCDNCGYFYDTDFDSVCPGCKKAPDVPSGDPVNAFASFDFPAGNSAPEPEPVMPVQEQFAPPAQEQFAPPVQEQFAPPAQEQFAPPVQEQFAPPVQEQFAPPVQAQYEPPIQAQYIPPMMPEADFSQETASAVKPVRTKHCLSCGQEISESNSFCRYCGAPQVKNNEAPPAESGNPPQAYPADGAASPAHSPLSPLFMEDNVILPSADEPAGADDGIMAAPTIVVQPEIPKEPQAEIPEIPQPEIPAAAKCPLCAKTVDNPDYLFCPYCGSALVDAAAPQPASEPAPVQPPVEQEAPPVFYPNLVPGQFMCENCGAVMNYGEKMCGTCFAPVSSMKGVAAVTNSGAVPADNSDMIPEPNPLSSFDYDNMIVPDFFAGDDSKM